MYPVIDDAKLASLHLFHNVEPASLQCWLDQCEVKTFAAGELLLSPLAANQALFIILQGRASVHLGDLDSAPIAMINAGESVGEMSLFDGELPSAYVKAETPLEVLVIPARVLFAMIDNSQLVARNLLFLLSSRLRHGNKTVSTSRLLQKEYEKHANMDALTGLHNRRWVDNFFQRIFANSSSTIASSLSILMVDVDDFKQFNDDYGHIVGDYALKQVADVLRDSVRPVDRVARFGGEEFLVILPDTPLAVAGTIAERICNNIRCKPLEYEGGHLTPITVSVGGAILQAGDNFERLISAADQALYQAKAEGKDGYRLNAGHL